MPELVFRRIMIVGAGASGIQIAAQVAAFGYAVVIVEIDPARLAAIPERLSQLLHAMVDDGILETSQIESCLVRVEASADLQAACEGIDLVVECVPEKLELKRELFRELNLLCDPTTIFASNTSFLIPSVMAPASGRPAQLACLHFHPPVRRANLVDVMPGPATDPEVVERLVRFAKSIGQYPIRFSRENPGYLFNSLLGPWLLEAIRLAAREIATPQEIDRAWISITKSPLGPFGVLDSLGIDLVQQFTVLRPGGLSNPRLERIRRFLQPFIDRGDLGQATGKGIYSYPHPEFLEPSFVPEEIWSRDLILLLQRRFRHGGGDSSYYLAEEQVEALRDSSPADSATESKSQRWSPPIGARVISQLPVTSPEGNVLHEVGSQGIIVGREDKRVRVRFHDSSELLVPSESVLLFTPRQTMPNHRAVDDEGHLLSHVLFSTVVGSRAYGLEEAASDADYRGVFLAPADRHWSLLGVPDQIERDATQEVYWELQRFLVLGLKANPNILETLYSPLIVATTPLGEELLALRHSFLSRLLFRTYSGYVQSQFRKFLVLRQQGRNPKWKHAMHLLRLLMAGADALREEYVPVRVTREHDRLMAVKRGEMDWDEIDSWRKTLETDFERAFEQTRLPIVPNQERVDAFLQKARRWAASELLR